MYLLTVRRVNNGAQDSRVNITKEERWMDDKNCAKFMRFPFVSTSSQHKSGFHTSAGPEHRRPLRRHDEILRPLDVPSFLRISLCIRNLFILTRLAAPRISVRLLFPLFPNKTIRRLDQEKIDPLALFHVSVKTIG